MTYLINPSPHLKSSISNKELDTPLPTINFTAIKSPHAAERNGDSRMASASQGKVRAQPQSLSEAWLWVPYSRPPSSWKSRYLSSLPRGLTQKDKVGWENSHQLSGSSFSFKWIWGWNVGLSSSLELIPTSGAKARSMQREQGPGLPLVLTQGLRWP